MLAQRRCLLDVAQVPVLRTRQRSFEGAALPGVHGALVHHLRGPTTTGGLEPAQSQQPLCPGPVGGGGHRGGGAL